MKDKPIFNLDVKKFLWKNLKKDMLKAKDGTWFWLDENTIAIVKKIKLFDIP